MKKTLAGLDNFYMVGQWVEPGGGMPTAVMSGRNVTQLICWIHLNNNFGFIIPDSFR